MARTGGDLDGNTNDVDEAADDDGPFAADDVGDVASNDCAEEGTAGQDRGDQRLVGRGERCRSGALDDGNELGEAIDTVDVSRVIAEEDTSEGSEGADQVGFPGHWSLDAIDIGGGGEGTNLARHLDACWDERGLKSAGACRSQKEQKKSVSQQRTEQGFIKGVQAARRPSADWQ